MNYYDYRGYIVAELPQGYYMVEGYQFASYDEACDWIDEILSEPNVDNNAPELHLYHIYYVTKSYDCGYDEFIQAYSEKEALKYLKRMHRDIAYIADVYEVD